MWTASILLKGSVSGWTSLAKLWARQTEELPEGILSSIWLGWTKYEVIYVGGSAEGLSLKTGPGYRVGHPPLIIPWDRVEQLGPGVKLLRTRIKLSLDGHAAELFEDIYLKALEHRPS